MDIFFTDIVFCLLFCFVSGFILPSKSQQALADTFRLPGIAPWRGPTGVRCPKELFLSSQVTAGAKGLKLISANDVRADFIEKALESLPDDDRKRGNLSLVTRFRAFKNASLAQIQQGPNFEHIWTWRPTTLAIPTRFELTPSESTWLNAQGCSSPQLEQLVLTENRGSIYTFHYPKSVKGALEDYLVDPLRRSLFYTQMFFMDYSFSDSEAEQASLFMHNAAVIHENGQTIVNGLEALGPLLNGPVRSQIIKVPIEKDDAGQWVFGQTGADKNLILFPCQGFWTHYKLEFINTFNEPVRLSYESRRGDTASILIDPSKSYLDTFAPVELPLIVTLENAAGHVLGQGKIQLYNP